MAAGASMTRGAAAVVAERASVREPALLPYHYECSGVLSAPAQAVFAHLDDHRRLGGHMSRSSWMMAGSRMDIELDAAAGRAVESHIRLQGRMLGMALFAEVVVSERDPPARKVWETIGKPRLLVIGAYRMGFAITPQGSSSILRVFIDYDGPETAIGRLLCSILGGVYARWCVESITEDAALHFGRMTKDPRG